MRAERPGTLRLTSSGTAGRQQYRAARPKPVPQWSGPLFGRQPENWNDYLARMRMLSADTGTHLYFDTSFLMLLAKLGPTARGQFMTWAASVGNDRFHVPIWSAHEFFKHRLQKTVASELTGDITKFDKAAKQLYRTLNVYASDQLFGFVDGGAMILDEFQRTVQPLRATLKMAASTATAASGVQHVSSYIDEHLLPGSLDELVQGIEVDERVRNRGSIPPAFNDAHKRNTAKADDAGDNRQPADNSFGDLVFWREVLRHAKGVRARAVIIITKDRKNDWYENFHGDLGLTPEFHRLVTNPLPVPTAHPLLVREARDFGAGTLDLIDPMYCGVLLEAAGADYRKFASAVMRPDLPDPAIGKKFRKWTARFGPAARVLGGQHETGQDDGEDDDAFDAEALVGELLRSNRPPDAHAVEALTALSDGDLGARTRAFAGLAVETLRSWTTADLVALGRLTTELAQQDMPSAVDFISNMRDLGPEIPVSVRLPLYFGALGALYLTRDLQPVDPIGARIALTLLDMTTVPEMKEATAQLTRVLGELGVRHAIGGNDPIVLDVVTISSANNKSPADLVALKIDGTNLITTTQPEPALLLSTLLGLAAEPFEAPLGALIDIVSRYHLLPRQLIEPNTDVDSMVRVSEFTGVETDN